MVNISRSFLAQWGRPDQSTGPEAHGRPGHDR